MNNIKQIREQFDLITEKEEKEDRKLSALVRAGLYDAKKLPALKRALEKSADKITSQEKRMLVNLLDSLISQVVSDDQVYRKVRQNVHNVSEAKMDTYSKFDPRYKAGWPTDKEMPSVLILKRKAIRVYPDNQKVALYYSQALDKYVTIPYNDIQVGLNEAKKSKKDEEDDKRINASLKRNKRVGDILRTGKVAPQSGTVTRKKLSKDFKEISDRVGGKAGAAGVMLNRYIKAQFRKKAIEKAVAARKDPTSSRNIAIKKKQAERTSSSKPAASKPAATEPSKPSAATQSSFQGKVRAMAKKSTVEENYYNKLQQLRETREVNEIAPLIAAVGAAARVAAPWLARGAVSLGGKALSRGKQLLNKFRGKNKNRRGRGIDVDVNSSSNNNSNRDAKSSGESETSNKPNYNFTKKPDTSSSFRDSPKIKSTRDEIERQTNLKALRKESNVLDTIKLIVENNIPEQKIQFNENEITINNTVAKKLLTVYESINKTNKKKMEQMLNENATSFNKVLMFAVRQ